MRIPRVRMYSGYRSPTSLFVYVILTLSDWLSHAIRLSFIVLIPVLTPRILLLSVWPLPRSLAATGGISVDYFSSPYLDVSVQAVPHICLFDSTCVTKITLSGFPHSDISGSQLICSSPKLFAAYHVLHRLLMPRHSPCALLRLTFESALQFLYKLLQINPFLVSLQVSSIRIMQAPFFRFPFG